MKKDNILLSFHLIYIYYIHINKKGSSYVKEGKEYHNDNIIVISAEMYVYIERSSVYIIFSFIIKKFNHLKYIK